MSHVSVTNKKMGQIPREKFHRPRNKWDNNIFSGAIWAKGLLSILLTSYENTDCHERRHHRAGIFLCAGTASATRDILCFQLRKSSRKRGQSTERAEGVSRRSALHGNGRRQWLVSLFGRCRCSVLRLSNQYSFQFINDISIFHHAIF